MWENGNETRGENQCDLREVDRKVSFRKSTSMMMKKLVMTTTMMRDYDSRIVRERERESVCSSSLS